MSTPHICPLCHGEGTKPGTTGLSGTTTTPCNACSGRGIVWEPEPVPYYPPYPPVPYYPWWIQPMITYRTSDSTSSSKGEHGRTN